MITLKEPSWIMDRQFWNTDGKYWCLDGVQFTEQGKDRMCNNPLLPSYSFCINKNYYQIQYGPIKGVEFSINNQKISEEEFKNSIISNYKETT